MYRLLSCTAVVVCMALTPALAADDSSQAGAPDQSTGAKEQSSAPPEVGSSKRYETYGRDEAFIRQHGHLPGSKGAKLGSSGVICIGSL